MMKIITSPTLFPPGSNLILGSYLILGSTMFHFMAFLV